MPEDVMGIVLGKSTFARVGIVINFTPLEAGWHGYITIEISNTTPLPAKIYANEGIAQILFFQGDESCDISYADKNGKYQGQQGITLATVE
jgi:dCTP deaminase